MLLRIIRLSYLCSYAYLLSNDAILKVSLSSLFSIRKKKSIIHFHIKDRKKKVIKTTKL